MENKIISALIFFLFLINTAGAEQDLSFTVKNSKGLCFYTADVDCQTCSNQTFTLNGSLDHMIYLAAQKPFGNCDNYTKDLYTTNSTEIITDYMTVSFIWELAILAIMLGIFLRWVQNRRIGS